MTVYLFTMTAQANVPTGFIEYLKQRGVVSKIEVKKLFSKYLDEVHFRRTAESFGKDADLKKILPAEEDKETSHLFI